MKKVLCFGDSNTYGFVPGTAQRYDENTRWTGRLKKIARDYDITEAGCNNRTAFTVNPAGKDFTGFEILPEFLKNNYDIIILAIGINDLQKFFNPSIDDIKSGMEKLVKMIPCGAEIILVSPSALSNDVLKGAFSSQFDETSIKKSKKLAGIYKEVADEFNCKFIDLDKIVKVSPKDGLHYEPEAHKKIADAIYKLL